MVKLSHEKTLHSFFTDIPEFPCGSGVEDTFENIAIWDKAVESLFAKIPDIVETCSYGKWHIVVKAKKNETREQCEERIMKALSKWKSPFDKKENLRILIREMKESQDALRPVRDAYFARRKANERQDGPNGFIMVDKK